MVTLFLAGDVMTGRGVDQILSRPSDPELREPYIGDAEQYVDLAETAHGPVPRPVEPSYIWGDALAVLEKLAPELAVINLETSITTSDAFWPGKEIHYRMHPDNIDCLAAARIDACALANNHVLDFDYPGLAETLAAVSRAGIATAGAGQDLAEASRPARLPLGDGAELLVFACGSTSSGIPPAWAAGARRPGVYLVSDLSPRSASEIARRVRSLKRASDLTMLSIHWGSNWGFEVDADQIAFAHELIDGGVDLIHGHSSHHVRPVEVYRGKLILYGCGDLLTDYEGIGGHEEWRGDIGAMIFATLRPEDGTLARLCLVPTQMRRLRLTLAGAAERRWLEQTLNRIGHRFGSRFAFSQAGSFPALALAG